MTEINWAELQKTAEEATRPLPAGDYPVAVESATATPSSKGNPMIKLTLRVNDGPATGRKLFTQITLSQDNPTAMAFFFRNLAAFGVDARVLAGNPSMEELATMLVDRQATATVDISPYQGVDRNNVKTFKTAGAGVIQGAIAVPTRIGGGLEAAPSAAMTGVPTTPSTPTAPSGLPAVGGPGTGIPSF